MTTLPHPDTDTDPARVSPTAAPTPSRPSSAWPALFAPAEPGPVPPLRCWRGGRWSSAAARLRVLLGSLGPHRTTVPRHRMPPPGGVALTQPQMATFVRHHLATIREVQDGLVSPARLQAAERAMVALALEDESLLPDALRQAHPTHCWNTLDVAQKQAVATHAARRTRAPNRA